MKYTFLSLVAFLSVLTVWGQTETQIKAEPDDFFEVSYTDVDYTFLESISDPRDQWAAKYTTPFECRIDYRSNKKKEVIVSLYTSKFEGTHYEVMSGLSWWGIRGYDATGTGITKYLTVADLDDMIKVYEKPCTFEAGVADWNDYSAQYFFPWEGFCEVAGEKIPFRGPLAAVVRDAETNEIYYITDRYFATDLTHNYISYIQVKPQIGETSITLEVYSFFNGEGEGLLIFQQGICDIGGIPVKIYNEGFNSIIKHLDRVKNYNDYDTNEPHRYFFSYKKIGKIKGDGTIQKFEFELIDFKTGQPFVPNEDEPYDVTFFILDEQRTYPTGIRSGSDRSKTGFLQKPKMYTANEMIGLRSEMEMYVSNGGSTLYVHGLEPSDLNCILFNLSGIQLLNQRIHAPIQTIDISKLPQGIYIVHVEENKNGVVKRYTKKIVK